MACSLFYFSGQGDCKAFRERAIGVILTKKNTVALTPAEAAALSTWAPIFADSAGQDGIYVSFARGYQNNTTEPEMTTSNLGLTEKTFDSPPLIKGFGEMSYADYKTFFSADGGAYDVWLVLNDGTIEAYTRADGKIQGRRAKVFMNFNAPSADNPQEALPIDISFTDVNQWKENSVSVRPIFTIPELMDLVPIGVEISVITAYTAGTVTLKAVKRNSTTPETGFDTIANWPILASLGDPAVTVTVVNAASAAFGIYTLTIKSNVTDNLTAPVIIRGEAEGLVAGQLGYVSQPLQINP